MNKEGLEIIVYCVKWWEYQFGYTEDLIIFVNNLPLQVHAW